MDANYIETETDLDELEEYTLIQLTNAEDMSSLEKRFGEQGYYFKSTSNWEEKNITISETKYILSQNNKMIFKHYNLLVDEKTIEEYNKYVEELNTLGEQIAEAIGKKTPAEEAIEQEINKKIEEYVYDLGKNINISNFSAISHTTEQISNILEHEMNIPKNNKIILNQQITEKLTKEQEIITQKRKQMKQQKINELIEKLVKDEKYLSLPKNELRTKYIIDLSEEMHVYLTKKEDAQYIMHSINTKKGDNNEPPSY